MQLPLQIRFHNMKASAEIEAAVRSRAAELEQFAPRIMSCRVVVDVPHRHRRRGNQYNIRLDIKVPGDELVVAREPAEHATDRDPHRAIHEAFDEARRLLQDHVRRVRGDTKTRASPARGRIVRIAPGGDYGFIGTPEGREIYFHRNSVRADDFDKLNVGAEVAFAEEAGEQGPQATTVRRVGRHHHEL
jgi:cold shock CspA family protein